MENNRGNDELLRKRVQETLAAEKAVLSALSKLAPEAGNDDQTKQVQSYLQRTSERIHRLEQIPGLGTEAPGAQPAIGAVLAELAELLDDAGGAEARQAATPSVLEAVRHVLIVRYAALTSWAILLGNADLANVLLGTLGEERGEAAGSAATAKGARQPKDISLGERLTALFDRRK